jgi:hypothetical protein
VNTTTPTLSQVRTQIGDTPRLCVKPRQYEMLADPGDGSTTIFGLRFKNADLTSLHIFVAQLPATATAALPVYVEALSTDPTYPWTAGLDVNGLPIVTFIQTAPDTSTLVGCRYLVTGLSDAQILTYLSDSDLIKDTLTLSLQALHYVLIPVILADREAGIVHRIQDRTDDPQAWMRLQHDIRKQLKIDLDDAGEGQDATGGSGSYLGGCNGVELYQKPSYYGPG